MHRRTRVSRRAAAAASAIALSLTLAACGGGNQSNANPASGSFKVLVYGDADNKVEQEIVAEFNKTSKIKADLSTIPGADYQAKLQTIISTGQAPDVFFNWGGGSIEPFVKAGLLLPLDNMIQQNPQLKSAFLPSVFNTAEVNGSDYGIPMRGTQPVLLFDNDNVLKSAGITPPKTWNDLLTDVRMLKSKGVTPIALGGGDQWPTQMWFEYLYDRIAGPGLFQKALSGDKSAWGSPDSVKALGMLKQLVDAGAFGGNFDSVKFTDDGSTKLLTTGKAGFELMGSWEYSTVQSINPAFAKSGLGWTTFPTVPGGKGNPADVVGNTNNFYSVLKTTKYADTISKFLKLMYSDDFVKDQLAIGNLPTTTNTPQFLSTAASPAYDEYQYNAVKAAPSFQLSWDQAYPPAATTPIHQAVEQFVDGQINSNGFIQAMQNLPAAD